MPNIEIEPSLPSPLHITLLDEILVAHGLLVNKRNPQPIFPTNSLRIQEKQIGELLKPLDSDTKTLVTEGLQRQLQFFGYVLHQETPDYKDYRRTPEPLTLYELESTLSEAQTLYKARARFSFPYPTFHSESYLGNMNQDSVIWALHVGGWTKDGETKLWIPPMELRNRNDPYVNEKINERILQFLIRTFPTKMMLHDTNVGDQLYHPRPERHQFLTLPANEDITIHRKRTDPKNFRPSYIDKVGTKYRDNVWASTDIDQWAARGILVNSIMEIHGLVERLGFRPNESVTELDLSTIESLEDVNERYEPCIAIPFQSFFRKTRNIPWLQE